MSQISIFKYFIIVVLFSSCAVQDIDLVKMNGYNVSGLEQNDIRLTLNLTLNNPNNFNVKVKKTKIKLTISGNDGGEVKLDAPVIIRKKAESDYEFIILADAQKVKSALIQGGIGIALTGKVNVNVKGWVKGKVFLIGKKVDVDYSQSFSLKDLGISQ